MKKNVYVSVIIVAAGQGTRMNMDKKKQYIKINGDRVLARTLTTFEDSELIDFNRDDTPAGFDMRALKDLPNWVTNNGQRPSRGRYTFTTWRYYGKKSKPDPAGLLGPVKIVSESK